MTAFQTCSCEKARAVIASDPSLSSQTENAILAFGNDTVLKSATNQAPGSNTNTYNQILVSTEVTTTTIGAAMETEQSILRPQIPTQVPVHFTKVLVFSDVTNLVCS